ncbi:MAG: trigger factor [candidate division WOR-3 bacterium]
MEVSIQAPKDWLREIRVEVEPDRLKSRLEKLYQEYGNKAIVPGFRKGRAPRHILERRLGSSLEAVAAEEVVEQAISDVIEQAKFRLASQVKVRDFEVLPDKSVRFVLRAEVFPEFELKNYHGLKLRKEEPTGFDQEFERRLRALQDRCATFKPVSRPAQALDYVTCNYQMFDSDKPLGPVRNSVMIQVGDKMNFEPVNQALTGVRPGDERTAVVDIQPDHPDKSLAGRQVTFRFTVREVKEKQLPEVNEDLASDLGYESLDALRQDINDQILRDRARLVVNGLKNQIFDFLVREHEFEPPESWVNAAYERLAREYELPDDEETRTKLMAVAVRRAKFDVIAARIAERERIEVTEQEINVQIEDLARSTNRSVDEVAPLLANPAYRNQVLRDKVLDFILEKADVS